MKHTYPSVMVNNKIYEVKLGEQTYTVFASSPKWAIKEVQDIRRNKGLRYHKISEYKVEECQ